LKITQLFPEYPVAHLYVGIESQFLGELQQAREDYTKAAALALNEAISLPVINVFILAWAI
jgi:hypothetical protein